MRRGTDGSNTPATIATYSQAGEALQRPISGIFPANYEVDVCHLDQVLTRESLPELPTARRPSSIEKQERKRASKSTTPQPQPTTPQPATTEQPSPPQRQRSPRKKETSANATAQKRRSLSTYGFEDLKMTKKLNQEKFPLLVRWGRSFSRRMSG